MNIGRFKLKLWPTLATLAGLALLLTLAIWQTRRYLHKRHLETLEAQRAEADPLEIRSLDDLADKPVNYRTARAWGTLESSTKVVVEHRSYNGDPGKWVLQPLRLSGDGAKIWVNRGWIPFKDADEHVASLPDLDTQPLEGLVHRRDPVIADETMRDKLDEKSGESATVSGRTTHWETFDVTGAYRHLEGTTPDRPVVLVLDSEFSGSRYPIASTEHVSEAYLTSGRHLSYAVFWYAVALALLAMYVANGLGVLTSGDRELRPRNRQSGG